MKEGMNNFQWYFKGFFKVLYTQEPSDIFADAMHLYVSVERRSRCLHIYHTDWLIEDYGRNCFFLNDSLKVGYFCRTQFNA